MNILGKRSDLPFSRKSDRKKEKSTVSFTHVQNIICSQTQLDGIAHEQTIICRQLFAGHVVGSRPMKRKKNLLRITIKVIIYRKCTTAGTRFAVEEQKIHKMNKNVMSHYWYSKIANIFSKTPIQATSSGEKVKKQLKFKEQMKEISKAQCQNNV